MRAAAVSVVLVVALTLLAPGAGATIVDESSYPGSDFSDSTAAPTPLGVQFGCNPFPACVPGSGFTDQVNGGLIIWSTPPLNDSTDAFWFATGAIDSIWLNLNFSSTGPSGTIDLYDSALSLLYSYAFTGQLTGFDLLSAWTGGAYVSGDWVADFPGGGYAIAVNVTDWAALSNATISYTFDITAAPEPGTYLLVGLGLAALALVRRRRRA